ncbi:survival motor neuron interacting protein 1-domain-containing protein [Trametes maxima]|nr:survival motor neuron interacting protein 1-domain-containing protein [Trametes maxima]
MSLLAKRKIDELDDSDGEEPSLGRQVLPVANLPDTFDGVPTDGLQYLFTVRRDARLLPHVTRAPNPYEAPEPTAAALLSGSSEVGARTGILPSEEWQETFLKRFKNFRKNSVQPTIHVHIPDSSSKPMPDKKERDLWWAYLAGHPESEWNPPKKPKQPKPSRWQQRNLKKGKPLPVFADDLHEDASLSYDAPDGETLEAEPSSVSFEVKSEILASGSALQSLPTPSGTPAPPDFSADASMSVEGVNGAGVRPTVYVPREPTPTLMQHIDHKYAIHLLMYFTHWINLRLEQSSFSLTDITPSHARWMFALLSRVDDWISGDETSLLRNLARACISLVVERRRRRASLGESEAGEMSEEANMIDDASCWMVVCAVTGFWGQRDLWMDAEGLLCKIEEGPGA